MVDEHGRKSAVACDVEEPNKDLKNINKSFACLMMVYTFVIFDKSLDACR